VTSYTYDVASTPFAGSVVQLSDTDLANFPGATSAIAQLSVQVSTGGTGWFSLAQALGTVTYSPQAGSKASIHTLTGTFSDLNAVLATFQIQYGINPVNAQSASVQLIVNDNGNGYAGVSSLTGAFTYPMTFVCGASTPAAQVQVAVESNDASFITVIFDRPIIVATSSVDCSTLFSGPTMTKLGADATCVFNYAVLTGVSSLVVTYGTGATFLASNDKLTIVANSIPRCSPATTQSSTTAPSVVAGDYSVTPGVPLSPPIASISAPSNIDPQCNANFTLSGVGVNVGARAPTYAWTLPQGLTNVFPVAPSSVNSASLVLKNSDFPTGTYVFSLVVTSFQGVSSLVATATVVSVPNAPVVTIRGLNPIQVLKGNDLTMSAKVAPSVCTPSTATVTSQWSFSPSIALNISASSASTPDLIVLGNTLSSGGSYLFTFTATVNSVSSSQSVRVNVMRSPLVVGLGGASSSQPFSQAVVLNAVKYSYDPDSSPTFTGLTFTYSCFDAFGNACTDKSSVLLNMATYVSGGVLTIPAVTLAAGVYTFGVKVTDSASGRTGSATTVVSLTLSALPSIQLACPAVVNPNALVSLSPAIGVAGAGVNASLLTYTWSSNQASVSFSDPASTAALSGQGVSLNTKFQTRYWIPNTNYLFSLTLRYTLTGETVSASCQTHINAAPTGCVFSSSTNSGSLNDSFALSVSGCYDPDGVGTAMLTYQFFYVDSQGTRKDISVETPFNSFIATSVLPVASNLVVGVRVFDQYRAVTSVNYANTLTITKPVTPQAASTFTSALDTAVNNHDTEKLIAGVTYLTNALLSGSVSLADSTTTATLRTSALTAISTLAAQLPTSTVTQQLTTLCSGGCDSSTALNALVTSFNSAYNVFPSNSYDASIMNSIFGLVVNLAQTSLFSTSSFHSNSMHLTAVSSTTSTATANVQSVITQSILAFSQSSALPLVGDGTTGFVAPNANISCTILRDFNFDSVANRFLASTYKVPVANSTLVLTLKTNANTFGAPFVSNTVGLDFAFTVMPNSPYKIAGSVPTSAFLSEPVIFNVNSVQATNSQLIGATSLTAANFSGDYVTVQQSYNTCTPATGSTSCVISCVTFNGNDWQLQAADTTSDSSTVTCKLRGPVPYAIVDTNKAPSMTGPYVLSWTSSASNIAYSGTFSPALLSTNGEIQLNVGAYYPSVIPIVISVTSDSTQPNRVTDAKLYTGCSGSTCSGTPVQLCTATTCASFAQTGILLSVNVSANSSVIRSQIVLTGANSLQTSIYINIVKTSAATVGPFVLDWKSPDGTFSSPIHTNGSTTLTITDVSFPSTIPVYAPWSTTGPNSAVNVVLFTNCKDSSCQSANSTTNLCNSTSTCANAGATGLLNVSLAGTDSVLSVICGLRLDGANGVSTYISFVVVKPSLVSGPSIPGAPSNGNIRVRIPLGSSSITISAKGFTTYSRFSTQSTVLTVNTKAFNDLLRTDICLALNISTDANGTYCSARVNVLSSNVDASGAYYAYVDLIPLTATANTTLYGDASVSNLFAKLLKANLKNFPNANLSLMTQYCIYTSTYVTTCSPPVTTSSGTPWYVPVIVVVVVVGVVGIAIAVYMIVKKRKNSARGGAKQLDDDDGVEMAGAGTKGSPPTGPVAAGPLHQDDGPMAVYGSVDDASSYPAAQPGIKYMYQPADWNPDFDDMPAQDADKSDVHLNLEDDHPQGKKAITPTMPKAFSSGIDNSNDTARFTYTSQ